MTTENDLRNRPPRTWTRVAPVVGAVAAVGLAVGAAFLIEQAPRVQAPAAVAVPAVPVSDTDADGPASASPSSTTLPGWGAPTPAASATEAPVTVQPTPTAPTVAPTMPASTPMPTQTQRTSSNGAESERVDAAWARTTAAVTGIPERALLAYAAADLALDQEAPGCYFGWNTVAAIGSIESRHGSFGGATLGSDGVARPSIIGVALTGSGVARITDSDGGRLDGDSTFDRAVGPLQFIPTTWARWASDGNGDGVRNPQQIDDAALAAARYLCAANRMDTPEGWRRAVLAYNNSDAYVTSVAETANRYARAVLAE